MLCDWNSNGCTQFKENKKDNRKFSKKGPGTFPKRFPTRQQSCFERFYFLSVCEEPVIFQLNLM